MLLTISQLADYFATDEKTVMALLNAGKIPHPENIGGHMVRWSESLLRDWTAEGCPADERPMNAKKFRECRAAIEQERRAAANRLQI
jgi:predicted DNA-binding transcriptional regulator AlpA